MAAAKRVLRYLCSTSGLGLVLGGRSPVVLTGHADASWADDQATQRSSQGYTFSLGSGSVSWRATRSSSVLGSSCEAEIYAGAMAALKLRWLTYLLTDLGEPPRSPPVLYVDNKAMLALCREQRLEHRTKHIALRYFLARELQQRGQLRLAYVASEANTADVFTKALAPFPSASSRSTEGGDPTAADTATSRRSPRLETPPGFPPRTSSPPLQPVAADLGGLGVVGGGDAGGAGSGDAASEVQPRDQQGHPHGEYLQSRQKSSSSELEQHGRYSGGDSRTLREGREAKMGHFIPTHTTARTEETAHLFLKHIISQHGIPTTLISDRDPKFTSKFWKELMSLMGTRLAMSSAYHPQTDGQTERLNQIVEQLLRAACKDDINKWDLHLPVLEFAYNYAKHAAAGETPFFLCYGRHPLTPQQPTVPAIVQPAHDFVTTMQQLWDRTHKRLQDIQSSQKRLADRHRGDHTIAVGDHVLLDTCNLNLGHLPSKLRPRFCGPFLVEEQVTPVTFRLCLPASWKIHNAFHVQLLKPYKDPNKLYTGRQPPPPPPVLVNDELEYEVESVLAHRRRRHGALEFLCNILEWKFDPVTSGGARSPLVGGVGGTVAGGAGSGVALVTAPASSPDVACALVAELAGFAATCCHAYLTGLVSASSCPSFVEGELALGCDVLEDRQFELEYLPYPLSIRTRYVAPGRHHPAHWRAARRVLRYLVRLASIT
ncbi:unnamed protein product [Closterium sp. NIES-54]